MSWGIKTAKGLYFFAFFQFVFSHADRRVRKKCAAFLQGLGDFPQQASGREIAERIFPSIAC